MAEIIGVATRLCECKSCDSVVKYRPSEVHTEKEIDKFGFMITIKRTIKCPSCRSIIDIAGNAHSKALSSILYKNCLY